MFRLLIPALLLSFVNVLGFSLLIPVLPFIVDDFGLSQVWYGALLSSYAAALFFGAPLLGALSDVFGRKRLLIISQAGTLFSWVLFAAALFIPADIVFAGLPVAVYVIIVSRVIDGLTGGNNSVVSALVSDVTRPDQRARAYGIIGATFGVGFMLGPALGGLTAQSSSGYLGTIVFAFCLSAMTLVSLFFLREPARTSSSDWKRLVAARVNVFGTLWSYRASGIIAYTLSVKFVVVVAFTSFTSVLSLFLIDYVGLSAVGIGLFFLVIGAYAVFNQGVLVGAVSDRIGSARTLVLGTLFLSAGMAAWFFSSNVWVLLALSLLFSVGSAFVFPTVKALLSVHADAAKQGEVMGLEESLRSLAQAGMPVLSALLYVSFGPVIFLWYAGFALCVSTPLALRIVAQKS